MRILFETYTFTAIESHSKLIVAWYLGRRTEQDTLIFLDKLYNAIDGATNRFQMFTDGFRGYDHTVNEVLGTKADYGQIIKIYGNPTIRTLPGSRLCCASLTARRWFFKSRFARSPERRANFFHIFG